MDADAIAQRIAVRINQIEADSPVFAGRLTRSATAPCRRRRRGVLSQT
jgi:hypothetical protein